MEAVEDEKYFMIFMELMEGGDLLSHILKDQESQTFSEKDARDIILALTNAVVYCHDKGIVHRDIKLENLLLQIEPDNSFTVKLSDFGLSRSLDEGELAEEVCGTLTYCAPEVLSQKPYDHSCDFWSIGVMMYVLLTGY